MKVGEMETSGNDNGRRQEGNRKEGEAKRLKRGSNGVKFIIGNHIDLTH